MPQNNQHANTNIVPRGILLTIPKNMGIGRFCIWIMWVLHRYRLPYISVLFFVFTVVSLSSDTPFVSLFECFCIFEGVMLAFATHETAHWGIATKQYGIKATYVAFIPYNFTFSVCFKEEGKKLEPKQRAWIYVSGPLIPIAIFGVIGIVCLIISIIVQDYTYTKLPMFICADAVIINLFSLLPLPGTDWSRVKDYYLSKNVLGRFFNKVNGFTRKAFEFFVKIITNR